jgi:ankyrin repeat protein
MENESHVPLIFTNALHVAVEYGAVDVVRLLLKYGLEPNQGGRLAVPEFNNCTSASGHGGGAFFGEPPTTVSPEVKTPVSGR